MSGLAELTAERDLTEIHGEERVPGGPLYYGDMVLERGTRYFVDSTGEIVHEMRDVDTLVLGFVTNNDTELKRAQARDDHNIAVLARLATILNNRVIVSRHRWLDKRAGKNRPLLFHMRNLMRIIREQPPLEADLLTPWWISARRRESYEARLFLEEYGTVENLAALVDAGTVKRRRLTACAKRKFRRYVRQEVRERMLRALTDNGVRIDDPVQTLADAVRSPNDWARPRVTQMIVEAAEQGPDGPLGELFPDILTPRTLRMMHDLNLVGDVLYKTLTGIPEDKKDEEDVNPALRVDSGELRQLLTTKGSEGGRHARVEAGTG